MLRALHLSELDGSMTHYVLNKHHLSRACVLLFVAAHRLPLLFTHYHAACA